MNGIDCSTKLTSVTAQALKSAGVQAVGRYLGRTLWNGLTPEEARAIHDAGLSLFLIWELAPTKKSYFTYAEGISDAAQAIAEAAYLGAPNGVAIYFTVDYDAQGGDLGAIVDYFQGVRDGIGGKYLVGAYGSHRVMQALKVDRYFQTYAWSYGHKANCNIYQYQNDVMLAGVAVDKDYVNEDAGLWKGDDETMDHAVVYFTVNDFSIAKVVADKLGGCAMFCRNASNANIHKDAMAAKHLVVIGGAEVTDHSNVTNCCGAHAEDTAIKAAQYAQTL